jgi:hypothetical protein
VDFTVKRRVLGELERGELGGEYDRAEMGDVRGSLWVVTDRVSSSASSRWSRCRRAGGS